jgi:hypothetical protein
MHKKELTYAKEKKTELLILSQKEKNHDSFKEILRNILPHIGTEEKKVVQTEVMIALKLEGIVGNDLTSKDSKLINIITDCILANPGKKEEALLVAERLRA